MEGAGADIDVYVNRMRISPSQLPVKSLLYQTFSKIPYPWVKDPLTKLLEIRFLWNIADDEIAYVWPAASLRVHRELRGGRG
jgi:hypothetical protein